MTIATTWQDYLELCKPRVVALMLLTAIIGMLLATPIIPWQTLIFGTLGIGFAACSAAVINQMIDRKIDALMNRTSNRPLPAGKITVTQAIVFAFALGVIGMFVLFKYINALTAVLTFLTLIGYAIIYTVYLKRATPQNIVIGGLAGATPPLLGWTAVTNQMDAAALLLVLLIFAWTPPHFWALAIARFEEYEKAKIPMLPVTHGIKFTTLSILLYTIIMILVAVMPFVIKMSGYIYLFSSMVCNIVFLYLAIKLHKTQDRKIAMQTFHYSILYLMLIFILLLVDHYFII